MSEIDFGRHSGDYAEYRPGLPGSFYDRIEGILPIRGTRSLDLATGPGTIALELASRGSRVAGIDISARQVATAQRVSEERGLEDHIDFVVSEAEHIGLTESAFDLATAGQCWHWFDSAAAMTEILRILKPGGVLVVAFYSYLAEHSPVAGDTEQLILEFNPSWSMAGWTGTFPELIDEVIRNGLELIEQFCYDHDEEFSHAGWRGRIRTCNGVGSGGLSPEEVRRFDEALGRLLRSRYPDPVLVEHRVWCVVARKPGSRLGVTGSIPVASPAGGRGKGVSVHKPG